MPGKSDDTYRPQAPTAKAVGGSLRTTRVNPATHSIVKIGRPGSSKTTAPMVKTAAQAYAARAANAAKKPGSGGGPVRASWRSPAQAKAAGVPFVPVNVKPAAANPTKSTTTGISTSKSTVGASGVTSKTQYPSSPVSNPDQGGGVGGLSPVTNAGGFGFDLGRLLQIGALAAIAILLLIYLRKHRPARRVPARNRKG